MKKLTFTILMAVLMLVNIQAQKQNVVKTSLTSIFFKTYVLDYERALNEDMSLQLGFYYTGTNFAGGDFGGFAVTPEFRYYLSGNKVAPNGPYVAPYVRYQSFTVETGAGPDYAKGTLSAISGGIIVGAQRTFKDKITLEAFIGPAFYSPKLKVTDGENDATVDLSMFNTNSTFVWGRAGINIGFMF